MTHKNKFIGSSQTIKLKKKTKTNFKMFFTGSKKTVLYIFWLAYKLIYLAVRVVWDLNCKIRNYVADWIDYFQRERNILIYDLDYRRDDPILLVAIKNRRRRRTSFIEPEENVYVRCSYEL